jgi:hypothetical protein
MRLIGLSDVAGTTGTAERSPMDLPLHISLELLTLLTPEYLLTFASCCPTILLTRILVVKTFVRYKSFSWLTKTRRGWTGIQQEEREGKPQEPSSPTFKAHLYADSILF